MGRKIELEVVVRKKDKGKRQGLIRGIDLALAFSEVRIAGGTYSITIERTSAEETLQQEASEDEQKQARISKCP